MRSREKGDPLAWASLKGTVLEIRVRDHDRRVVARAKKGLRYVSVEVSEKLEGSTARRRARLSVEARDRIVRAFEDAGNSRDGVERLLDQILSLAQGSQDLSGVVQSTYSPQHLGAVCSVLREIWGLDLLIMSVEQQPR